MIKPCGLDTTDRQAVRMRPVKCDVKQDKCASCGFNPAVERRRLENGKFFKHTVTHDLHDDDGNVVASITNEVRTLKFARG